MKPSKKGLYNKYTVINNVTNEEVKDCFVLKPTSDEAAKKALLYYAEICGNEQLANDIKSWLNNEVCEHFIPRECIVNLPCTIGDDVWDEYGHHFVIEKIEILNDGKKIFRCGNPGTDDYMAFHDFEINKSIFFTPQNIEKE